MLKNEVKKELPSINNFAITTVLIFKINKLKRMPNITNLATTTAAFIIVENKIPNVSNLIRKTNYNTKISEIENKINAGHDHDRYITIQEPRNLRAAIVYVVGRLFR